MAKLIDVAQKAGVSITTASMALTGKGRISEEVRKKVNDAADSLGYKKSRKNKKQNWLVLQNIDMESDTLSFFFNPLLRRLYEATERNNFQISLLPFMEATEDDELSEQISTLPVDGLFSIHSVRPALFEKLEKLGIPCIILNNASHVESFFTVCVDDFHGAYEGTTKLIDEGHQTIAYMDYHREKHQSIVLDRYLGFTKAIRENGLTLDAELKATVDIQNINMIEEILDLWFRRDTNKVSAIFFHDDLIAGKAQFLLKKKGISVPDDVSLIAPGDTRNYEAPETERLTTMRIDTDLMGQYALTMMKERMDKGEQAPHVLKIRPVYTDRGTVKSF